MKKQGSAATIAYLELVKERADPAEAISRVNETAQEVMTELVGLWEESRHRLGIYDLTRIA
jgi:hypothetical protein